MTATTKATANGEVTAPLEVEFPVDSYREAARHMRRPFTPAAVKYKPQDILGEGKGIRAVAYIDARLVIERLNLLLPHLWSNRPEMPWQHLTVDGITRSDIGEGTGKALASDALKRAAVHFGIGVSLYAVPQQILWADLKVNGKPAVKMWKKGDKWSGRIEPGGVLFLRDTYTRWLDLQGVAAFGRPLDHGDAEGSQGDAEVEPPAGMDAETGEVEASAPAIPPERVAEFIADAKLITEEKIWTGAHLKAQLVAAGAGTIASAVAAAATLTPEALDELHSRIVDLLAAREADEGHDAGDENP